MPDKEETKKEKKKEENEQNRNFVFGFLDLVKNRFSVRIAKTCFV